MVLGLENVGGLEFLDNISFSGILQSLGSFAQILFWVILIAGSVGAYFYFKSTKKTWNKKIHIFEEVNGRFVPSDDDVAIEVTIPNTTVKVFYLKKYKIYLPRPTIQMGKDHYWYGIRRNREWVNFRLKDLDVEMSEAGLDFDHTDMRYANTHLKKLIRENYNKEKWYEKYASQIAIGLIVLLLTFSFWFLMGRLEDLISMIGSIMDRTSESCKVALETLNKLDNICSTSGIARA